MKNRLWHRVLLTLLSAFVIGAMSATFIGVGVASADISTVTIPAQSPAAVAPGSTASFTPITIQDSDNASGHWVKLVSASGLPAGAAFVDTGDACVEDNSSGLYTFTHAQVTTTSSTPIGTSTFTVTADRYSNSGCTTSDEGPGTGTGSLVVAKAPIATTSAATGTTTTTATLNGSVTAENASTAVSFCYSTSSALTSCGGATSVTASPATATGTAATTESAAVSGLTSGTEYYFQIKAVNSIGTTYGSVLNFTTLSAAPLATTSAATGTTGTGTTLNGSVNAENLSTAVTFCYSTSSALASCGGATSVTASPATATGSSATTESAAVGSLTPNTTYYFQIKAVSSGGTTYGSVLNFTTTLAPVATTSAASGTTATGSTLNGSVNAENLSTAVTFCYSTSSALASCGGATSVTASPATATGASSTTESAALTGLAPNTEYYFQIEAVSTGGTTYGSVLNFTTSTTAPTATTSAASGTTGTGTTLNGSVNAENSSTTVTFCYSTSSALASCGGATSVTASPATATGASSTTESAALTGLSPNTTYYFQIKAVSSGGTTYGSVLNFTTTLAPTATTSVASGTTATGSTLNGSVNAENLSTAVTFCYSTSSAAGQLLGRNLGDRQSRHGDGRLEHLRERRSDRPQPQHRVLLPDRGREHRWHHLRLGPQLHHLDHRPGRHDQRGERHDGNRYDPQRFGQRGEFLDDSDLLLQHVERTGQLWRRHQRDRQPGDGHGRIEHHGERRGGQPDAQHDLLLPDQGGQLRRDHLRFGAQLHHHLGPRRHDQRGERHHGDGLDPQRLGQRGERRDLGRLLLQHVERAVELHGRNRQHRGRKPRHSDGCLEHHRERRSDRPQPQHRVLLPDRSREHRWHHLRLGAQLHHLDGGPGRDDERGERHDGNRYDPQRLGQRGEFLDDGDLLLQHVERTGQLWRRHQRDRQPGDGDGCLEHHGKRRADRPQPEHDVLLPDQGGQLRRHDLRLGAELHHHSGADRDDERGERDDGDGVDPQRLG